MTSIRTKTDYDFSIASKTIPQHRLNPPLSTELDDVRRLAWRPKTEVSADNVLTSGWYRIMNGLQKLNEECTPVNYGGASYPGWMDGGHPAVGETVDRLI